MMNKFSFILMILCIILISYILSLKCNDSEFETKIDTITINTVKRDLLPIAVSYPELIVKKDTVYLTDTILVFDTIIKYVTDYLAKKTFLDTILNDSMGFIAITDTIYKNSIISRESDIKLYNKTMFEKPKKNHLYFGGGFSIKDTIYFKINLDFQHKKHMFGIERNTKKETLVNYSYMLF